MTGVLQLFPARVPIGTTESGEKILASPEFWRALSVLFRDFSNAQGAQGGTEATAQLIASMGAGSGDFASEVTPPQQMVVEHVLEPAPVQPMVTHEAHKVGDYILRNDLLNPAVVHGYGTWVQVGGGFPAAYLAGDPDFGTMGATGGERSITIADHATHTHDTTASATVNVAGVTAGADFDAVTGITPTPATSTIENPTPLTHVDGTSGLPDIAILPPYLVVAVWLRTA